MRSGFGDCLPVPFVLRLHVVRVRQASLLAGVVSCPVKKVTYRGLVGRSVPVVKFYGTGFLDSSCSTFHRLVGDGPGPRQEICAHDCARHLQRAEILAHVHLISNSIT